MFIRETLKEFDNGGKIEIYGEVDRNTRDLAQKYTCCEYFARQGEKTVITPKIHYKNPLYREIYGSLVGTRYDRKCPDFKVGNKFYEHEGFDVNKNTNPKRTFKNMISRGFSQSDCIVIEDCNVGRVWAQRIIYERTMSESTSKELWIREKNNTLKRLF